ncbi:hypothetical protein OF122_06995 [Pelagibacterium flavum]|uniref:HTH marR-type domain-containing protein n=1 Tax=Pelagibacterium flavum TaxID=2984530 RepID=A0ABY6IVP6_9HYPH|nr:hypothetical protein [Pelagibacterium sp. YIM 151497]UYQ73494.1 hypothetical protein OF122_06995 [Pelagibacterium sp. YIM 151497]
MFFFFLGAREPLDSPELERFGRALEVIQTRYPTMTLGMLSTLFAIGMAPKHEGALISMSDLVEHLSEQKYSTVARQLELLGEGNDQKAGMGLIEKRVDPNDRRTRYVALSDGGRHLLYELDAILAPDLLSGSGTDVPVR